MVKYIFQYVAEIRNGEIFSGSARVNQETKKGSLTLREAHRIFQKKEHYVGNGRKNKKMKDLQEKSIRFDLHIYKINKKQKYHGKEKQVD